MAVPAIEHVLSALRENSTSLTSGNIDDAMKSAVVVAPLYDIKRGREPLSQAQRCEHLLREFVEYLKRSGIENPERVAYHNLATDLGHHPSSGLYTRHYDTWRPVLDKFQEEQELERVSWFR